MVGGLSTSHRMKVLPSSLAARTRMVLHFLQESILPKEEGPVPIKITNQVVSKVNHFSKTTHTKKAQCHLQKRLLSMVEEMGDMILSHFPVTLIIIVAFSLITDPGKVIVVLDLVIWMQYKIWVCKIVVPIEAHINIEVNLMIEASISNAVDSVIPTVVSSTNIVDSHRMVDEAKEGVCNFIGIPNITLPSPQGLTACSMFHGAFFFFIPSFIMSKPFIHDILWTVSIVSHFSKHSIS